MTTGCGPGDGVSGAVLTGGASRRMGAAKPWLTVGGVPMAARVASALEQGGCDPVCFIGAAPGDVAVSRWATVPDEHPGEGPVGGVITALRAAGGDVVVAACDLPWIDAASVTALLAADSERRAAVVSAVAGGRHVPLALWRAASLPRLDRWFADGGRSWSGALAAARAGTADVGASAPVDVELAPAVAVDVDTPDDLAEVRHRPGDVGPPAR